MINIGDVITGALVNALAVVGRRFTNVIRSLRGDSNLDWARWFDTASLTESSPDLPFSTQLAEILRGDEVQAALHELLPAIGEYLVRHPDLPWFGGELKIDDRIHDEDCAGPTVEPVSAQLGPYEFLGAASILAALTESDGWRVSPRSRNLGPVCEFSDYLGRRDRLKLWLTLPDLPVPYQLRQMLRDWADGRIDITTPRRPIRVNL